MQLDVAREVLSQELADTKYGLNTMFVLFGAFSVFLMQVGAMA